MPNHVTTRCTVTGPIADVDRFHAEVICVRDGDDIISVDFEKVIPMPAILKESSNWHDAELGIEILTGKPNRRRFPGRTSKTHGSRNRVSGPSKSCKRGLKKNVLTRWSMVGNRYMRMSKRASTIGTLARRELGYEVEQLFVRI